jgi:hypothetical protein
MWIWCSPGSTGTRWPHSGSFHHLAVARDAQAREPARGRDLDDQIRQRGREPACALLGHAEVALVAVALGQGRGLAVCHPGPWRGPGSFLDVRARCDSARLRALGAGRRAPAPGNSV